MCVDTVEPEQKLLKVHLSIVSFLSTGRFAACLCVDLRGHAGLPNLTELSDESATTLYMNNQPSSFPVRDVTDGYDKRKWKVDNGTVSVWKL